MNALSSHESSLGRLCWSAIRYDLEDGVSRRSAGRRRYNEKDGKCNEFRKESYLLPHFILRICRRIDELGAHWSSLRLH
jgi:hypothetical protein